MKVRVTAKDIENGVSEVDKCPVALALKRRGWKAPDVDEDCAWDADRGDWKMSKATHDWIMRFDTDQPVKPFTAELTRMA